MRRDVPPSTTAPVEEQLQWVRRQHLAFADGCSGNEGAADQTDPGEDDLLDVGGWAVRV